MSRKHIALGKVQAARKQLKKIAREELLRQSSPENVTGWESVLQETEMGR